MSEHEHVTVVRVDDALPYVVAFPATEFRDWRQVRLTRAEAYELSAQLLLAFAAEAKGIARQVAAELSSAERDELAADRAYEAEIL